MTTTLPTIQPAPLAPAHPTGVMVIDDHPAVRRGVRALIDEQTDMTVIAQAAGVGETLAALTAAIDVVVIDYQLGTGNGLELVCEIRSRPLRPATLVYSAFADEWLAVGALVAGADGLLSKRTVDLELCLAVRRVAAGMSYLPAIPAATIRELGHGLGADDRRLLDFLWRRIPEQRIGNYLELTPNGLERRRARLLAELIARREQGAGPRRHAPLGYGRGGR